jgi:hypothetical protein
MRKTKYGNPAFPPEVHELQADTYREVVQDLMAAGLDGGLIAKYSRHAELCDQAASAAGRGRPKKIGNALAPASPDKPESNGYDLLTYRAVEDCRKWLIATNKNKGGITDAVKALAEMAANDQSTVASTYLKASFEYIRRAYYRGKKSCAK